MELKFYGDISKVDENQRMVFGYASTTALDSQGDIITKQALSDALVPYMKFANIREMHQPNAVGVAKTAEVDEKGIYISAKVVDDKAWEKVKEGVYKGFSIGGKSILKKDNVIEQLSISEISLVDRPANPECVIEIFKSEMIDELNSNVVKESLTTDIEKIAERQDTDPKEGKDKYGDVKFADERNKKYPIDTEEHIRAAWNYINQEKNVAKYSNSDASSIKSKILSAWKSVIGGQPPSAEKDDKEKSETQTDIKKGMMEVSQLSSILSQLDWLQDRCEDEAMQEGDNSPMPAKIKDAVKTLATLLQEMVKEETDEMTTDDEDMEKQESEDPTTDIEYSSKTADVKKIGARNSGSDKQKIQAMHDMSMELGASCGGADSAKLNTSASEADGIQKLGDLKKTISDLETENTELKKKITDWENLPKPSKVVTKFIPVSKEDDTGMPETQRDMSKVNDPRELFKMAQSKPVPLTDFLRQT